MKTAHKEPALVLICILAAACFSFLALKPVTAQATLYLHARNIAQIPTDWHELYPTHSNEYLLSGWQDNGDGVLSPCDNILLTNKHTAQQRWYHIDDATITLFLAKKPDLLETRYIELAQGYAGIELAKTQPLLKIWREIYPTFGREYQVQGWVDNGNGVLSEGDEITILRLGTTELSVHRIDEFRLDLIVSLTTPTITTTRTVSTTLTSTSTATTVLTTTTTKTLTSHSYTTYSFSTTKTESTTRTDTATSTTTTTLTYATPSTLTIQTTSVSVISVIDVEAEYWVTLILLLIMILAILAVILAKVTRAARNKPPLPAMPPSEET